MLARDVWLDIRFDIRLWFLLLCNAKAGREGAVRRAAGVSHGPNKRKSATHERVRLLRIACMPCMSWPELCEKLALWPEGGLAAAEAASPFVISGDEGMVERLEKGDSVEDESMPGGCAGKRGA